MTDPLTHKPSPHYDPNGEAIPYPEEATVNNDAPKMEPKPDLKPATADLDPAFLLPGAGGWTPTKTRNLIFSCIGGAMTAAGTLVGSYDPAAGVPFNTYKLAGAAIVGCAAGAIGYLGIGSAGTRKL